MAKTKTVTPTPSAATESVAARCLVCGATKLEVLRIISQQDHTGIGPDGNRYTAIIRRRVRCQHCGKHQLAIERTFDPKRWK